MPYLRGSETGSVFVTDFGATDLFLAGVTDTRRGGFQKIRGGVELKNSWKNACFTGYLRSVFRIKSPLLYRLSYALNEQNLSLPLVPRTETEWRIVTRFQEF
jgi:hypothetical protein